jgi:RNA polymerase sigma factor (sigma-70 family)
MAFDDDARLVASVCAGDEPSIEAFVSTYRQLAFAILTRYLNLPFEDADEVFQRFLFHLWENNFRRLRRWSGKTALSSYLTKILRNLAHDYRRQLRFESKEIPDLPIDDPGLMHVELRTMMESALRQLSEQDRDLIHRRFYLEQSYAEMAAALGVTENSLGVALTRAKRRLRNIL